ncbi:MAG: YicC/YloC family endoribonuclease [Phycisphaeraceae bacterium]|nr:YicC/YloC family endoribonuclease [Phycisphaeraceae bacterium]
MIHSMTGFGDAAEQVDGVHYSVELRTLNNRYFKATVRLPEELSALEPELEVFVRKRIHRGSVVLAVTTGGRDLGGVQTIDSDAVRQYLTQWAQIKQQVEVASLPADLDIGTLMTLPGVVRSANPRGVIDSARPILLRLTEAACGKLHQMRQAEGRGIVEDLQSHCRQMRSDLEKITERAPSVVEEYHDRLKARVEQLAARAELEIDHQDLIREVAIFAERADISEELQRLGAHLDQFLGLLEAEEDKPIGRTLDFITQELLREANTIASKSNDAQIGRTIVQVKGTIDRIKEQVQNIE